MIGFHRFENSTIRSTMGSSLVEGTPGCVGIEIQRMRMYEVGRRGGSGAGLRRTTPRSELPLDSLSSLKNSI